MNTLLAILLYMQVISSPNTYNEIYIRQLEGQYQMQIQQIQNDPQQMQIVNSEYLPLAEDVIVISSEETRINKIQRDFSLTKKSGVYF